MKKYFALAVLMTIGCLLFINGSFASEKSTVESEKSSALLENILDNKLQTRCGWFSNPTPANAWLNDKDGEWLIGAQGGHQAEGDYPDFKKGQWVKTNGSYGYGCTCIKAIYNLDTKEVVEIKSSTSKPLSVCKKDKKLKRT